MSTCFIPLLLCNKQPENLVLKTAVIPLCSLSGRQQFWLSMFDWAILLLYENAKRCILWGVRTKSLSRIQLVTGLGWWGQRWLHSQGAGLLGGNGWKAEPLSLSTWSQDRSLRSLSTKVRLRAWQFQDPGLCPKRQWLEVASLLKPKSLN